MWSREERDKEKRNKGIDVDRTDKASRGNDNDEEETRESEDEVHGHGRSFLLLRNRLDKGQQNMDSPEKGTRSTTRGDVGPQREGRGRKKK